MGSLADFLEDDMNCWDGGDPAVSFLANGKIARTSRKWMDIHPTVVSIHRFE